VRKVLAALGLLALALLLFLVEATWALYLQTKGGKPAWRLGAAMGSLRWPIPLAEGACRLLAREDLPLCARGYMRKRLTGPLVGDPTAPCRGLSPAMARACSEVQGLRLVEEGVSRPIVVCEAMPYPKACALYVGRAAFARGGFRLGGERSAERICAQGRGVLLPLRRGALLAGARLRPPRYPAQGGGPGSLRPPLPPRGRPVRGPGEGGEIEEEVEEKARGEGP
jgi:hypothetical protein